MGNIVHADIFFLITSIAVVCLTICLIVVTVFLVRILRDVKHISETVDEESTKIAGDIEKVRLTANAQVEKLKMFGALIPRFFTRKHKAKPKGKAKAS